MGERATLILVCGLPGAGKTTLARALESERKAVRMCPDERMRDDGLDLWDQDARDVIESSMWAEAQVLLRDGRDVILEYGFWPRAHRDPLLQGAREIGAAVEIFVLDPPLDVLIRRVERRIELEAVGEAIITRADIECWWDQFERPTPEELALYDRATVLR